MLRFIRSLSDRTEFVLVTILCFAYPVVASLSILVSGTRRIELTTGRVLRAIAIEVLTLCVLAVFLRVRGWRIRRLGLEFSWKAAAAGIPVFVLYLLLYWIAATFVLMAYPAARSVWVFHLVPRAPFYLLVTWIVINSLFEELSVTAYVIGSLSRDGAGVAIAASTLLRFAYHLYQGPLASLSIIPLGLLFGAMYWRWRNIWPLMVAHTIANVVAFVIDPQRVSG